MNIINALPGIVPTARPYTMGQWPQKRKKMRNGRVVRWALCNRPTGDKMELVWENITFAEAELLCSIWDANYGIYGGLKFAPTSILATIDNKIIVTQSGDAIQSSSGTLAGTSLELAALLAAPFPGATWHFAAPPQVDSVKARRCSVRMPIRAEISFLNVDGANWTTFDSFTGGSVLPGVGGAQWITLDAFVGGAVSGADTMVPGADWSTEESFAGGSVSGAVVLVPGADWSSIDSFVGGDVSPNVNLLATLDGKVITTQDGKALIST